MSDLGMILVVLLALAGIVIVCYHFVAQGYREAVAEPSTCHRCRKRRPGQFCSRCGHKKF